MATTPTDQNGIVFQRRYSRAYDKPVVQNTSKGLVVREAEENSSHKSPSAIMDTTGRSMNALGGYVAKVTLGGLTLAGVLASLCGKASLEALSQLFGFLVMFLGIFIACVGCFYWWGTTNKLNIHLSVRKVVSIYCLGICGDTVSRLISIFTAVPPTSPIPADASYFISLATILLFGFSLLVHRDGLNAMFSQESVLFVACTMALNFSATCLFRNLLPLFLIPHVVYVGLMLGMSFSLVNYRFPSLSLSRIYRILNQTGQAREAVDGLNVEPVLPRISIDNSQSQSRKVSSSSTMSSMRQRMSSISSVASTYPPAYDNEVMVEAHGLITELLFDKETLPTEANNKLRRIKDILAPRYEKSGASPRVKVGNQIDSDDHDYESDVSSSASSLWRGNHLTVQGKKRSHSVVHHRRSTTEFATTTTSSSGMPVYDKEPVNRARSQALRDVKARISIQEKRYSVHKMGVGRERSGSDSGRLSHTGAEKLSFPSESDLSDASSMLLPQIEERSDGYPTHSPISSGHLSRLGSQDDPSNLKIIEEGAELDVLDRPRSATLPSDVKLSPFSGQVENQKFSSSSSQKEDTDRATGNGATGDNALSTNTSTDIFFSFNKYKRPSQPCDLSEYTSNEHLDMFENVAVWDYPIFELENKSGNHILSHMAHMLFHEAGLMETFQIPQREFINYFRALEYNYGGNVYHNKTHAADVLHAVSYLMFEIIPEFSHEFSYEQDTQREWKGHSRIKGSGGNIASSCSILEVLACYMASAMHDFDHPGRTNAFLVSTKSPLALLYNDRSVLENHHAATSWHLLTSFPENNFLLSFDESELKRLRFLIIEGILATDLKMHFDILSAFRSKVDPEEGGGIDWDSEVDRMLVMKMVIKMADINTPTKSFDLHRTWTMRITEEFYQQSEEEIRLNLPATIFMDRNHPEKLPAIQLSFIQHLVSPLFQACAEAGIIPGIVETLSPRDSSTPGLEEGEMMEEREREQRKSEGEEPQAVHNETDLTDASDGGVDDAFALEDEIQPATKFMSIILTNLQINYEGWKAELPPEERVEEEAEEEELEEVDGGGEEEVEEELKTIDGDASDVKPKEDTSNEL